MKRQWLGDDHDVRKYCLLKFLSDILENKSDLENKPDLVINWMSTEDENLVVPEGYNELVKAIKGFKTINDMSNLLNVNGLRHKSISTFGSIGNVGEKPALVFFDPNTGIMPSTINKGEENNYLSYDVIKKTYNCTNVLGVLIYQHAIRAGKKGESKSTAQKNNIYEKIDMLVTNYNLPDPLVFLGSNKKNKKNEYCFEEAYILLVKDDEIKKSIQIKFPKLFNEDFLQLKNKAYFSQEH